MTTRKIFINGEEICIEFESQNVTIQSLAEKNEYPKFGVAIAVNQEIIPQNQWNNIQINDGDKIVVIKAACGG